ncbi:hypothetical protein ACFFON_10970 [Arthrobacter citreus]|uniref:hypothetical protein n=1 Tax=Arthrobacter TaxID=1663 RepID=UPI001FE8566A|nr:hypothetical protein [Arthrobacter gandavensis]
MERHPAGWHNDGASPADGRGNTPPADAALDLGAALAIVETAERDTRRQLNGNASLIYLLWGLAWLAGYGALEGSRHGWLPLEPAAALVVLGAALLIATVATVAVSVRASLGIRGLSAFQSRMYGASWILGFLIMGILSVSIGRAVDDFWLRGMLINSTAVLIVGLLYVSGGATFNDRRQCFLGLWLLAVTAAALLSGPDHFLTVYLYLGSGGMLAGSLAEYLGTRRRTPGVSRA